MVCTPTVEVSLELRFGAAQRYVNAAQGLPRPPDLEFVLFEKKHGPDKTAAALLTFAQVRHTRRWEQKAACAFRQSAIARIRDFIYKNINSYIKARKRLHVREIPIEAQ
jgi:hypothetical protein